MQLPHGTPGAAGTQQWVGSVGAAHRDPSSGSRDTALEQDQMQQEAHRAVAAMSLSGGNPYGQGRGGGGGSWGERELLGITYVTLSILFMEEEETFLTYKSKDLLLI